MWLDEIVLPTEDSCTRPTQTHPSFETATNISEEFTTEQNFQILMRNKENKEKNLPTLEPEKFLWLIPTGDYILKTNNSELSYSDLSNSLGIAKNNIEVLDGKKFEIFKGNKLVGDYLTANTRLKIDGNSVPDYL